MPGTAPTENALEVCLRPKTWARWGTQKWDLAQTFAASTVGKPCKADSDSESQKHHIKLVAIVRLSG